MSSGDVSGRVLRLPAGQQHAVYHGVEAPGRYRSSSQRRDRLRGNVCLLRADAAVLDGKVGRVAGRVDVLDTWNPAIWVHLDEAMLSERDATYLWSEELG